MAMLFNLAYEESTEVIGAHCTLLEAYKGYDDGQIVGDFGTEYVVRLCNGKELVVPRDEVIIYD